MPRYDLVLLDCDGTLYNTYPGVRANYENTLREMGLPEMPADYDWNRCIGPLLEYSLGKELGVPEDRIDDRQKEKYMKKVGRLVKTLKTCSDNPRNGEGSFIRLSDGGVIAQCNLVAAEDVEKLNLKQAFMRLIRNWPLWFR